MKRIHFFIPVVLILVFTSSCVDDYTKSNPPHLLDAPTFRVSAPNDLTSKFNTVPINRFQNGYEARVTYTSPVVYTVSVIDARGKIGDITASISIPDYGSVALDQSSVDAIQGQVSGEFKLTFTPSPPPDLTDRSANLVITVSDMQKDQKGEDASLTTTMTIPLTLVPCLSEGIKEGTYLVTAASGNLDGGGAYTLSKLTTDFGDDITVSITEDAPGRYTIDEVTGGVWPTYYSTRANPALKIDLCGNTISGHLGDVTAGAGTATARTFTINGTLNSNGTITITWSYVRDSGATPASPAKGTYTLTLSQ